MLQRIADLPGVDDRDLTSIDWILQGAAPMPSSLVHRWIKLIGAPRIIMAYGMTESIGITVLRGDEWLAHVGSVGRGFRGTEIRILDDDHNQLPTGEVGEIYLRNPIYGGSTYPGKRHRCVLLTTASRRLATSAPSMTTTSTWSTGAST